MENKAGFSLSTAKIETNFVSTEKCTEILLFRNVFH